MFECHQLLYPTDLHSGSIDCFLCLCRNIVLDQVVVCDHLEGAAVVDRIEVYYQNGLVVRHGVEVACHHNGLGVGVVYYHIGPVARRDVKVVYDHIDLVVRLGVVVVHDHTDHVVRLGAVGHHGAEVAHHNPEVVPDGAAVIRQIAMVDHHRVVVAHLYVEVVVYHRKIAVSVCHHKIF